MNLLFGRPRWATRLLAVATAALSCATQAQTYPDKPIHMIVAFAPGGSTDVVARLLGQKLSDALGVAVVIENRPGANGVIGCTQVAKAPPDGYLILMGEVGCLAMNPPLYPKLAYSPARDFSAVSLVARTPLLATVRTESPIKSLQELIDLARSKPGKLNYPSSGTGGPNHLATELFDIQAKVKTTHVPYKGGGPAALSLVTGETDFGLLSAVTINSFLQSGKVRPLAVASEQRLPSLPQIPTFSEAGLPGFTAETWFMVVAPAGTPRPIIERLSKEIAKALPDPLIKERFASVGAIPVGTSPDAATAFLNAEISKWTDVVRAANIKLE